jgi:hypothetical protein
MKKTYKYLTTIALSGAMCLFIALSASAQHRGSEGGGSSGGGGGSRPSGGGSSGGSSPRPSVSPSSSGSRPSGGGFSPSNGGVRPSGGGFRPSGGGFNPSANRPSYNGGYRPANGVGFNRPGNGNTRIAIAPPRTSNNIATGAGGHRVGINPGVNSYGGRSYVNTNARSYVGGRGYVGQGGRASVGVGGRGFYGPSYWRNSNYYHYYHGYYGTYYAPRLGFSIGFLPYGYYPFYYGDSQYFYSAGLFYQYDNSEYTVVEPPVGAEVNELPSNAQPIMINGEQYYEANGVYYEAITKDDGSTTYQVAGKDGELNTNNPNGDAQQAPQVGDIVDSLPPNCRKISLNGEKYYVSEDGYYYQDFRDSNNNKAYKIVGTPDEAPQN